MTIEKTEYEDIIKNLEVGNSVAEKDILLEAARVETPIFRGVVDDKYDIVLGRKGAGKTAIYILLNSSAKLLLSTDKIVILSGVNSEGEPIFNKYHDDFDKYTEADFENFWKLYFINLIYNQFLKSDEFKDSLISCGDEISKFKKACIKARIPEIGGVIDRDKILAWVVNALKSTKLVVPITYDTKTQILFAVPTLTTTVSNSNEEKTKMESIYVHEIGVALSEVLIKSGFKIWIILDRLDEVFERYTKTEFKGLRGLLRAYKSFDIQNYLRIKLFLRDDIKSFLTDAISYKRFFPKENLPPLPAATHILARETMPLSWSQDEIQQLILNRLLNGNNFNLRKYLGIYEKYTGLNKIDLDSKLKEELRNKDARQDYWNKIFPEKIGSAGSLTWIFSHLKDSNDIVTPRSVIDMLEGAINYQKQRMQTDFQDSSSVFPIESLKMGIQTASDNKLKKDVYNEFPREQKYIEKLKKEGKFKLSKKDLKRLYGIKWEDIAENLRKIGILRYIKNSNEYGIVYLYRPALGISYKY